mmetsp:Transcript_51234/g.84095  ORF Transcript_51234/g.84095 Transcript_51234/m.84095 type:complete len:235 (-) Transcript_51234:1449-2153(-)
MDLVWMQHHLSQIEADSSHVLLAEWTFLGGPLEGAAHRILDVCQVLCTNGAIHHHVGTITFWTKAPDLALSHLFVPSKFAGQKFGGFLAVSLGAHVSILNGLNQLCIQRFSLQVEAVVLVGRLRQTGLVGLLRDGLAVGDYRIGDREVALGELLPQVFQADLHVQFSAASNDMLTALFGAADHQLVGFREPLQAFHQFGEVLTILGLHCHLHHRRHAVLHVSDVVGILERGDGS